MKRDIELVVHAYMSIVVEAKKDDVVGDALNDFVISQTQQIYENEEFLLCVDEICEKLVKKSKNQTPSLVNPNRHLCTKETPISIF